MDFFPSGLKRIELNVMKMAKNDDSVPGKLDTSNLAREWPNWKQEFSLFMRAIGRMN